MSSRQQSFKNQGDVVFEQRNFQKAIELYTTAINADASSELACVIFSARSLCHHKLGNFQEALDDGMSATELRPDGSLGYLRVASAYESLGKEDEAIEAYQKSLDREDNEEAHQKYIALFRKNVDNTKKSQEELKIIGNGFVQKHKFDEAVVIYSAAIDLDPSIESAAPIYSNRSLCLFNLGRFQEAEADARTATTVNPSFARGYLRLGNAAMKLEKWKESLETFEKYSELDHEEAKSDPEFTKNKNLVKKRAEQAEAESRKHQGLMTKTREELMNIKDSKERSKKAKQLAQGQIDNYESFDVDLVRVAVECGAALPSSTKQNPNDEAPPSLLASLLATRPKIPATTLPRFDELLHFIIDVPFVVGDIPFAGSELALACSSACGPLSVRLIRTLLQSNRFDVNQGFDESRPPPLISLASTSVDDPQLLPSEIDECLQLVLNWKGIDVNAVWHYVRSGLPAEMVALCQVRHPEIAKLLISHGANVNATTKSHPNTTNVLEQVLNHPENPHLEALVRLLIQSGARLMTNGRDGKSSLTISAVLFGVVSRETVRTTFVPEEVFRMILQLNEQQGLSLYWDCPTYWAAAPALLTAIQAGSPIPFVEMLCAKNPAAMNETAVDDGSVSTVLDLMFARNGRSSFVFEESMQVLAVLLKYGLDLFRKDWASCTTFKTLWCICVAEKCDLNVLKSTIVEKIGEAEFARCFEVSGMKMPEF